MAGSDHRQAVVAYYDTHPINEHQILERLERDGITLEGLTEADLQAYDQDHYGGLAITEQLADDAGIGAEIMSSTCAAAWAGLPVIFHTIAAVG
ncbi:MAG: hypothetical protein HC871_15035 [Rhizobiales bacterium]|nr:hypothetical protein [Hyphomicrobiales bacterium]